ncbi:DUF6599 family protein [Candidatus Latescibacterota bacterium]
MKKIMLLLTLTVLSGCLFPVTRNMHRAVTSFEEYTARIITECDATGLGNVMPDTAPLFIEFGCDSCLVAEVVAGSETITVESVAFRKSKGAMGAFLSTDIANSRPVDIGFMGRSNNSAIEFLKGKHLVLVTPKRKSGMDAAYELAVKLEKKLPGDPIKPDVYEVLPRTQLIDGSQLYFAGLKTFSLGFAPDLGETLRVGGAVEGAAAEYEVDGVPAIFIMIRYVGRGRTLAAVNSYLNSRKDRPIIRPGEMLDYYTVIEPDRSESFIAENGDWLYLLINGPSGGGAQTFFTYVLRGGR